MTVRAGRHRLTGMVSLGNFHDDMKKIESGKFIKNLNNYSYIRLLLTAMPNVTELFEMNSQAHQQQISLRTSCNLYSWVMADSGFL
jgi:hypothetical protein